ncbi:MAG: pyruvate kinase [Lysobacterales bacterium]|jgi:pyruvate kinase
MAERGANVVRMNFSHGEHKAHQERIDLVRHVNKKYGYDVKILGDLAGYRIRLSKMKKNILISKGDVFTICREKDLPKVPAKNQLTWDYDEPSRVIPENADILIDDGCLVLKGVGYSGKSLKMKVVTGGVLKSRKGVNIPQLKLVSNIMTKQDKIDLDFCMKNELDFIAQSFVRNKKDIQRVMDIVKPKLPRTRVIAKIESEEGVRNVDAILESCDGAMVARGDLGVTMPLYKIPIIQKHLIRRCMRKKKIAITATQMLETMITEGRPTRAEVSDIANAILDGTNYIMLSGETAIGKYPSRCVQTMTQIIRYTEKYLEFKM